MKERGSGASEESEGSEPSETSEPSEVSGMVGEEFVFSDFSGSSDSLVLSVVMKICVISFRI